MSEITTTYLEMTSPEEVRPKTCADPRFVVREATVRQGKLNRFLYSLVGEPWSWGDKNPWDATEWQDYVNQPNFRTFVACYDGSIAGYFELRRDESTAVEIVYFGLAPEFIGRGFGGALLTEALCQAWNWAAPTRVWVHTCTRDHPAALSNYQARGLRIYDQRTAPSLE